jgi:hypothetical protein
MTDVKKDHLSIVICGEVDSGKSTTTGHLLFALGGISDREMERLKQTAKELGKDSFAFAFYMDNNKEERERGITIQCNTKEFFTDSKHYTIIDAPGHRDFINYTKIIEYKSIDIAVLKIVEKMRPAYQDQFLIFYPYVLENFIKNAPELKKYLEDKSSSEPVVELTTGYYSLRVKIDYPTLLKKFNATYENILNLHKKK